jgi:SH3-like domain-containing protein
MLIIGTLAGAAGAEFPYTAYVNSGDVYVRSGPGRNYYPTAKLRKGQKVEIYRHDPGGWLAIRPPRDSFAWVSKRHLDPAGDSLATVNSDRVVARVGSAFSDVRDVIQVRLERGEKVELVAPPADDSPWCKIAPPSGEFRWVFAKYVDRELPGDLAADQREADAAQGYVSNRDDESGNPDVHLASASDDPQRAAGAQPRGMLDDASTIGRELNRVNVELSAMVAQDLSAWNFDELKHRVETVLRDAQTSIERGHARLLLAKLERFDDIRKRHEALRGAAGGTDRSTALAAAGGGAVYRDDASRFDGIGRLSPVISEKVGGPQFALVDNSNAVISFVTPAPGVNLRPYVDQYVGVNGQRGYLTELERHHISVQRVTVLDVNRR